jgi:glycosyltransferase involved in cell wall biosynthesis
MPERVSFLIIRIFFFQVKDNTSLIKKRAIQRADHIIGISENTKKDMRELFDIDSSKISVIYHGYSSQRMNAVKNDRERPLAPYILYVGERGGYKNFTRFLQAYISSSQLREHFKIICFGGGLFSDTERDNMENLGIKEGEVLPISGDDIS